MLINGRQALSSAKNKFSNLFGAQINGSVDVIRFRPSDNQILPAHISAEISSQEKIRVLNSVGIKAKDHILFDSISTLEFSSILTRISAERDNMGVIIQNPIPSNLTHCLADLAPHLDIDNITGRSEHFLAAATSEAAFRVATTFSVQDDTILILGHGFIGKGIEQYIKTTKRQFECADIGYDLEKIYSYNVLVSCTGIPGILKGEKLKAFKLILDIGFTPELNIDTGEIYIYGDIDRSEYTNINIFSPVPGGIGPLEMATILERVAVINYNYHLKLWSAEEAVDSTTKGQDLIKATTSRYSFSEMFSA